MVTKITRAWIFRWLPNFIWSRNNWVKLSLEHIFFISLLCLQGWCFSKCTHFRFKFFFIIPNLCLESGLSPFLCVRNFYEWGPRSSCFPCVFKIRFAGFQILYINLCFKYAHWSMVFITECYVFIEGEWTRKCTGFSSWLLGLFVPLPRSDREIRVAWLNVDHKNICLVKPSPRLNSVWIEIFNTKRTKKKTKLNLCPWNRPDIMHI